MATERSGVWTWKVWKPLGWFVTLAISVGAVVHFDPLGWRAPQLVPVPPPPAPGQVLVQRPVLHDQELLHTFVPFGPNKPTVVSVENKGVNEGLVQAVSFVIDEQTRTPIREQLIGQGPTIAVNFLAQHYDRRQHQFLLALQKPLAAPGNHEYTTLEIAIVEPGWVGTTYKGSVTIFYSGGKKTEVRNVELDVLSELPPPPSSP